MTTVVIERRFCGPPGTGNGGYVAGLLAEYLPGSVEVTLRRPTPLDRPLTVVQDGETRLSLYDGQQVVAEAQPVSLPLAIPRPPSPVVQLAERPEAEVLARHPFPTCFVCGPTRPPGDGLRIMPVAVSRAALVAARWSPHSSLVDGAGLVLPVYLWAALGCPGGFVALDSEPRPILLGQLTAQIARRPAAGELLLVIGWRLGSAGRKHTVGTAIFGADGEPCAWARAIWIEPRGEAATP